MSDQRVDTAGEPSPVDAPSGTVAPEIAARDHSRAGRHGLDAFQWVVVAIGAVGGIALPLTGANALAFVFVAGLVLAFTHGIRRYGQRRLLGFFLITFVVSNFWEDLSIATGFPFGHYHYTGPLQLVSVPIHIGIVYFGLGYISWSTANVLLGSADRHLDARTAIGRVNLVALPLTAGTVMTMFDVGVDSISSTVQQNWIWRDGGGLFGVPWTNYVGWWFVTWSFFQVFTIVLASGQRSSTRSFVPADQSLLQPVLLYTALGVSSITAFIGMDAEPTVTDLAGTTWRTADLFEAMMIVNIFGMVSVGLLALFHLARTRWGSTT